MSERTLQIVKKNKINDLTKQQNETFSKHWCRKIYLFTLILQIIPLFSMRAYAASTVWQKASEIFNSVYTELVALSTIVAIVSAVIALLMMNLSKSGRTVDEARSWLKRIAITWAIINGLAFIMAYVLPFFQGGIYQPS